MLQGSWHTPLKHSQPKGQSSVVTHGTLSQGIQLSVLSSHPQFSILGQ